MAVGFLEIILTAKPQAAIQGMKAAQFAAQEAVKIYAESAVKINRSIDKVSGALTVVGDAAAAGSAYANKALKNIDNAAAQSAGKIIGSISNVANSAAGSLQVFRVLKDVIGIGITKAAGVFPKMFKSIGALAGPIGIATAGLGSLYTFLASNFDTISNGARVATNGFIKLYNNSDLFRVVVETLRGPLEIAFQLLKGIGNGLRAIQFRQWDLLGPIAKKAWSDVEKATTDAIDRMSGADPLPEFSPEDWNKKIADPARKFLKIKATIQPEVGEQGKKDLQKFKVFISEEVAVLANLSDATDEINKKYSALNDEGGRLRETQKALTEAITQASTAGLDPQGETLTTLQTKYDEVTAAIGRLSTSYNVMISAGVSAQAQLSDSIDNINKKYSVFDDEAGRLQETQAAVKKALLDAGTNGLDPNSEYVQNLQADYERLNNELETLQLNQKGIKVPTTESLKKKKDPIGDVAGVASDAFNSVDIQSQAEMREAVRALNAELLAQQAIISDTNSTKQQKQAAQAQIAILRKQIQAEKDKSNALKQAASAAANAARKEIKANIASGISSAIKAALGSGVPPPFNIILAASAGAAAGALFEKVIPKFARGGAVFGKTLAVVGDNPNAQNDPEIIAPQSILAKTIRANTPRQTAGGRNSYFELDGLMLREVVGYSAEYQNALR